MGIEKLEDYRLMVRHDGSLQVATGRSRMDKNWKNRAFTWGQILAKLKEPARTPETHA